MRTRAIPYEQVRANENQHSGFVGMPIRPSRLESAVSMCTFVVGLLGAWVVVELVT